MNHFVSSAIFTQLMGEAQARQDYECFLAEHSDVLEDEDIEIIQEIQRDEANHMLKLQAMARKYDGDLPASSDGALEAVSQIVDGVGGDED